MWPARATAGSIDGSEIPSMPITWDDAEPEKKQWF
jgi:hypothetical protein